MPRNNRVREDLTGRRFGRLTVLSYSHTKYGHSAWLCQCDCGSAPKVMGSGNFKSGAATTCGCLRPSLTHGQSASPTYNSWSSMKARCYNSKLREYKRYGGRGIQVCDRWLNGEGDQSGYECFVADLGKRPSKGLSLDRINTNGNYEPSNCRWATAKQQMRNNTRNRIIKYRGHQGPLVEMAERFAVVGQATVCQRLYRGWPVAKALELPKLPTGQRFKLLTPAQLEWAEEWAPPNGETLA